MPVIDSVRLHIREHTSDWRSTRRAASKSLAPMKWATCTEKPIFTAAPRPPMSHVVVSTRPMEAVAFSPRWPTMAASMKNITVALIWARMLGMDS